MKPLFKEFTKKERKVRIARLRASLSRKTKWDRPKEQLLRLAKREGFMANGFLLDDRKRTPNAAEMMVLVGYGTSILARLYLKHPHITHKRSQQKALRWMYGPVSELNLEPNKSFFVNVLNREDAVALLIKLHEWCLVNRRTGSVSQGEHHGRTT
jgi:hypothetical protein